MPELFGADEGATVVDLGSPSVSDTPAAEPVMTDNLDGGESVAEAVGETPQSPWYESYLDQPVEIVVNGQTKEVPLAELRKMAMMHEDYTRKTQEIAAVRRSAEWADQFANTFRQNPKAVIDQLVQQARLTGYDFNADPAAGEPTIDPLEQEILGVRSEVEQLRFEREVEMAKREMETLKSKYDDFDPQKILPIALERNIPLEEAYDLWWAKEQRTRMSRDAEAKRKADEAAAAQAAAREAAGISSGHNPKATDVTPRSLSLAEIFRLEKAAAGG